MLYSIGQMSKMLDVSSHTLRYYEKEGIIPEVQKTTGGARGYTEEDYGTLKFVMILRDTGMPLSKIKEYIISSMEEPNNRVFRRNILVEHKKKIIEDMEYMEVILEKITRKIAIYDKNINC